MRLLFILIIILLYSTIIEGIFVPPSKPNYNQLELLNDTIIHKDINFITACKEKAGYYINNNNNQALSKVLLMVGINYSYRDFFHNYKCYMDRIGVKFLPISLDSDIYNYITTNKISTTYLMPDLAGRDKVRTQASGFGGKPFNLIGCRKLEAVTGALKLGYDVIFSDVDIAVVRDPINYLFFPGVDYVHSENNGCARKWSFNDKMEGNTGYYAAKSNQVTIRTWELAFKACSQAPLYDDQTMFWLILRTNTKPLPEPVAKCPNIGGQYDKKGGNSTIVSCPLDSCMFSASNLREGMFEKLMQSLRMRKQRAVMAHANWMNGREKKKAALVRNGLWIAQKVDADGKVMPIKTPHGAKSKSSGGNPSGGMVQIEKGGSIRCKEVTSPLVNVGNNHNNRGRIP